MSELNPHHPVTQQMRDHWSKIAAVLVHKMGGNVTITEADFAGIPPGGLNLVVHERNDGLHLEVVDDETAMRIASNAGGMLQ